MARVRFIDRSPPDPREFILPDKFARDLVEMGQAQRARKKKPKPATKHKKGRK